MSWNINALSTYLPSILARPFDLCFVQEVSAPTHMLSSLRSRQVKCRALLTRTDLELAKTGGVGVLNRSKVATMHIKPMTTKLKKIINGGRVQITGIILPGNVLIVAFNIYLWTTGHTDPKALQRSIDLLDAVTDEWDSLPPGPKMPLGDFNCELDDLTDITSRLQDGSMIDLGAHAHLFGRPSCQPTCAAHNSAQPTRRDYVLASPDLFPLVQDVQVLDRGEVPVHSPIVVNIKIPDRHAKKTVLQQPITGLAGNIRSMVKEIPGIKEHEDIPKGLLEATANLVKSKIDFKFQEAKPLLQPFCPKWGHHRPLGDVVWVYR